MTRRRMVNHMTNRKGIVKSTVNQMLSLGIQSERPLSLSTHITQHQDLATWEM